MSAWKAFLAELKQELWGSVADPGETFWPAKFMKLGDELFVRPGWNYEAWACEQTEGWPRTGSPELAEYVRKLRDVPA